ncbi:hypothetical protein [Tuwongella immobilis]|uniref:Uncharacterized protein n=1 Tax=Tuwongella immobilis TaxID=692036 RepID=A0A6C2YID2_9BACT|nr:hypothetical protein [Tuwongella immobilis]VIP01177.1 Uncharacterized protein OS=Pseudomonas alcaligenes NBRC 14159 GN=PA6_045_00350 PE=4 SV=1 [Tuwongella immobilis]VTR97780.1 Uncharacterized protein OS=Pseudomonas alcaligenes NBRC 14159 GN=PA6_045_00350 PE=4 SV=1 [Tuwongella immobilis]
MDEMWQPIGEAELRSLIAVAEGGMTPRVLAFWERVRIGPVKWALPPIGDDGGGFWVVAIVGQECLWYNDIEDGFNISRYDIFGQIADYWCNQSELQHCVAGWFERFQHGIFELPTEDATPEP